MTMRAAHGLLVAGGVLTVGLIIVAWSAAHSRSGIESRVTAAAEHRARLQREWERLQRVSVRPPANETASKNVAPPAPKLVAATEPPLPARTRPPGLMDYARNNPQLWNEFIRAQRADLSRRHLPLWRRLNLTAEQRERFKDILAGALARSADIGAAADAQGLTHSDPAIVKLREESEQRRKNELAELLGPMGFQEFANYERVLPLRGFVDGLAVQVAANAPLSMAQADQLERALADANEAYRNGKGADPRLTDWESVDRRAREILTPEQFAAWQLGVAHNPAGGSRRSHELTAVYERAVKRMKQMEGIAER